MKHHLRETSIEKHHGTLSTNVYTLEKNQLKFVIESDLKSKLLLSVLRVFNVRQDVYRPSSLCFTRLNYHSGF